MQNNDEKIGLNISEAANLMGISKNCYKSGLMKTPEDFLLKYCLYSYINV